MPKVVDKEQRKLEIAFTALDLFAEKGFNVTSISDIAAAAGMGKGTIYDYFESKEELIVAALQAWMEFFEKSLEALLSEPGTAEERLRRLIHASVEAFINDERTVRLSIAIFQLALTERSALAEKDVMKDLFSKFRKTVIDLILEGISEGSFRSEVAKDAELITINLLAYLDGIALHYYLSNNLGKSSKR